MLRRQPATSRTITATTTSILQPPSTSAINVCYRCSLVVNANERFGRFYFLLFIFFFSHSCYSRFSSTTLCVQFRTCRHGNVVGNRRVPARAVNSGHSLSCRPTTDTENTDRCRCRFSQPPPTVWPSVVAGSEAENGENVGLACACTAATDRHGSQATGRRYVVVRHVQRERYQTAGIAAERFQMPVHGDEEEVSADQRGAFRCHLGRSIH